jgi:hypothetical protein
MLHALQWRSGVSAEISTSHIQMSGRKYLHAFYKNNIMISLVNHAFVGMPCDVFPSCSSETFRLAFSDMFSCIYLALSLQPFNILWLRHISFAFIAHRVPGLVKSFFVWLTAEFVADGSID